MPPCQDDCNMVGMAAGRSTVNPSDPEAGFQRLELEFLCRWRGGGGGAPSRRKRNKGEAFACSLDLRRSPPGLPIASTSSTRSVQRLEDVFAAACYTAILHRNQRPASLLRRTRPRPPLYLVLRFESLLAPLLQAARLVKPGSSPSPRPGH